MSEHAPQGWGAVVWSVIERGGFAINDLEPGAALEQSL